ncbi:hypothetical protein HPB47_009203 [Ixodes persulcatus]|uniref:Uncharacterized protein n=1 Tax=Ixodes persulcatus TaxID=34615 RepID=A0AC60P2K6_IXOPE|nr:hypothetical protein HPB47_009203 [Ixodes persulcatus]
MREEARGCLQENGHYIAAISDVLRFTAIRGIAQRADDKSFLSNNKGNVLELLHFVAKSDVIVLNKLQSGSPNAKYTHHSIQDEIFFDMSDLTVSHFKKDVDSAQFFALMVDESHDISKTQQLFVVLRYFLNGSVYERFLGFKSAKMLDAAPLYRYIKESLWRCGILLENCIAQMYDGSSVLSGKSQGIQALLTKDMPQAVWVYCLNHRLILVIVDACKALGSARTFFTLMETLCLFLGGSATHAMFLAVQKQVCGKAIKGISKTM